eukprot:1118201-Pelagomonas_calceolata.AAC.1
MTAQAALAYEARKKEAGQDVAHADRDTIVAVEESARAAAAAAAAQAASQFQPGASIAGTAQAGQTGRAQAGQTGRAQA